MITIRAEVQQKLDEREGPSVYSGLGEVRVCTVICGAAAGRGRLERAGKLGERRRRRKEYENVAGIVGG
jgi:hypothetical protein